MTQKNVLFDEMPFAITVDGIEFILRTDFRLWIKAGYIIQNISKVGEYIEKYAKEKNEERLNAKLEEKYKLSCELCDLVIEKYPEGNDFTLLDNLVYGLLQFYKGFPQPPKTEAQKKKEENKAKREKDKPSTFDFSFDARYVYGSFASYYGIRLQTIEYMHWWEFLELFNELLMSDQTSVNFVVGTRQQTIKSSMPKAEKERIKKLKEQFELPSDEDTVKAENKTLDFLRAGKQNGTGTKNQD